MLFYTHTLYVCTVGVHICVYDVPYQDTICSCNYTFKRSTCFQNIICKKYHLHVQSYYCVGYNYLYNQKYQKKDMGNVYSLHLLVVDYIIGTSKTFPSKPCQLYYLTFIETITLVMTELINFTQNQQVFGTDISL